MQKHTWLNHSYKSASTTSTHSFLATTSFHCSSHLSSYPSHLLFFFLSSPDSLNLLSAHMQGLAHKGELTNLHHSKGEEEETRKTAKDDDAWLTNSKGNLLHTQWKPAWLSCLEQKQGLSLPEWWKMCTSRHVNVMVDTSSRNIPVYKHKQHQTGLFRHSPHLRRATTKLEEIPWSFVRTQWNICIFSLEEGQVTNSASSSTVDTTE